MRLNSIDNVGGTVSTREEGRRTVVEVYFIRITF